MIILAFESSCDETAAAVVRDGRQVLSDAILSQADMHAIYGGVVPEIASRKHVEAIAALTDRALSVAGIGKQDIDAVAVTYGPGLIGALLVGVNFAKAAAYALDKPLIPVHHLRGHIAANYIAFPELEPPFLALCISGGNSMLVDVRGYTDMSILGCTRDDAAGECFDKIARVLGLPYPGLKTAAVNLIHNASQKGEELDRSSLAASVAAAISEELVPRAMKAAEQCGYKTLVAAGGVAANKRIRADLERACQKEGIKLYLPPLSLCGDNGAMIGCQAYYEYLAGTRADMSLNAYANLEI